MLLSGISLFSMPRGEKQAGTKKSDTKIKVPMKRFFSFFFFKFRTCGIPLQKGFVPKKIEMFVFS